MADIIKNNSEILFIYDASMCNPNGDIDEENRPRMDYSTETNLVSDVRLKRYIRDYWIMNNKKVFVSGVNGETVDATQRIAKALVDYVAEHPDKAPTGHTDKWETMKGDAIAKYFEKGIDPKDIFIDIRTFGAVLPIKNDTSSGLSSSYTGPVQFNWGRSFNKVNLVESSSISSVFAGRGNEHSTIGKDWRVYYSVIGFWGVISSRWAGKTKMTEDDLNDLEDALIHSIPLWVTRSKVNQKPLIYMRIEYNNGKIILGDKRHLIKVLPESNLRSTEDYKINFSKFMDSLKNNKNKIKNITVWKNDDVNTEPDNVIQELKEIMGEENVIELKDA